MNMAERFNHLDRVGCESKRNAGHNEEDGSYDHRRDLEEWYEKYMKDDFRAIETVDKDDLENEAVEQAIYDLLPNLRAVSTEGYCAECQCFLEDWSEIIQRTQNINSSVYKSHAKSSIELEASSRNGCRLCILWLQSIPSTTLKLFHKIETRLNELKKPTTIYILIPYNGMIGDPRRRCLLICCPGKLSYLYQRGDLLYALPVLDDELPSLPDKARPIDSTNKVPSLARKWITECSNGHDHCQAKEHYQLPTRLISVKENCIRLVLTSDWTTEPRYATLSHCWGNLEFLKLTRGTLDLFLTSIPVDGLSQTFKDAIEITRELGLQYLWIDSLCIIQNDLHDWEVEASLMSTVYRGSHINIAAAAAINGNGGCFQEKLVNYVGKVRAKTKANECTKLYDFVEANSYERAVPASHLASRAWALQERLLATRTLHFGRMDLFWECKMKDACESFPEKLPDLWYKNYNQEKQPLEASWLTIVPIYSRCNLTYSSDKLVAISGVARAIQEKSNDQYLAGLWRRQMEIQLCWFTESGWEPRPKTYRAPSWSWASIDCACNYSHSKLLHCSTLYAHVLDANVVPSGLNSLGQVCAGVLKLGCTAMLLGELRTTKRYRKDGGYHYWQTSLTITFSSGHLDLIAMQDCIGDENGTVFVLPIISMVEELPRSEVQRNSPAGIHDNSIREVNVAKEGKIVLIKGLILRPTNASRGEYQRVGYFEIDCQREGIHGDWVQAVEESGTETAGSGCAEILTDPQYPDEKYVITLI